MQLIQVAGRDSAQGTFHDAGQFYWGRTDAWLRGNGPFSEQSLPVILPRHLVQDIDTEDDIEYADYLLKKRESLQF